MDDLVETPLRSASSRDLVDAMFKSNFLCNPSRVRSLVLGRLIKVSKTEKQEFVTTLISKLSHSPENVLKFLYLRNRNVCGSHSDMVRALCNLDVLDEVLVSILALGCDPRSLKLVLKSKKISLLKEAIRLETLHSHAFVLASNDDSGRIAIASGMRGWPLPLGSRRYVVDSVFRPAEKHTRFRLLTLVSKVDRLGLDVSIVGNNVVGFKCVFESASSCSSRDGAGVDLEGFVSEGWNTLKITHTYRRFGSASVCVVCNGCASKTVSLSFPASKILDECELDAPSAFVGFNGLVRFIALGDGKSEIFRITAKDATADMRGSFDADTRLSTVVVGDGAVFNLPRISDSMVSLGGVVPLYERLCVDEDCDGVLDAMSLLLQKNASLRKDFLDQRGPLVVRRALQTRNGSIKSLEKMLTAVSPSKTYTKLEDLLHTRCLLAFESVWSGRSSSTRAQAAELVLKRVRDRPKVFRGTMGRLLRVLCVSRDEFVRERLKIAVLELADHEEVSTFEIATLALYALASFAEKEATEVLAKVLRVDCDLPGGFSISRLLRERVLRTNGALRASSLRAYSRVSNDFSSLGCFRLDDETYEALFESVSSNDGIIQNRSALRVALESLKHGVSPKACADLTLLFRSSEENVDALLAVEDWDVLLMDAHLKQLCEEDAERDAVAEMALKLLALGLSRLLGSSKSFQGWEWRSETEFERALERVSRRGSRGLEKLLIKVAMEPAPNKWEQLTLACLAVDAPRELAFTLLSSRKLSPRACVTLCVRVLLSAPFDFAQEVLEEDAALVVPLLEEAALELDPVDDAVWLQAVHDLACARAELTALQLDGYEVSNAKNCCAEVLGSQIREDFLKKASKIVVGFENRYATHDEDAARRIKREKDALDDSFRRERAFELRVDALSMKYFESHSPSVLPDSKHWRVGDLEDAYRRHALFVENDCFSSHADAAYRDPSQLESGWYKEVLEVLDYAPRLTLSDAVYPGVFAFMSPLLSTLRQRHSEPVGDDPDEIRRLKLSAEWSAGALKITRAPKATKGLLELTSTSVRFRVGSQVLVSFKLNKLVELHPRRHLLRNVALELFLDDGTQLFFAFESKKMRPKFVDALMKRKPSRLEKSVVGLSPASVFKRSKLTEKWQRREMSNFEYLMALNTLAGRSYNDITQYPVFPWVLAKYDSESIDLTNPRTFRDLSRPVGCLLDVKIKELREKFEALREDGSMIPFHHGSHYSSAGVVLHYLVRVEPYTSLAVDLQGGRFDCPDRLFFSVAECFNSCLNSASDVKELTPEWFYMPSMFNNLNRLNLGKTQSGDVVWDVELPPWAQNSSEEFVRVNRLALESEYVSSNLHRWIDLIFGHKQRGSKAEEACNVFYHLTYEGAVDLDDITSEEERRAISAQIRHFGQTPSQLLTKPHVERMSRDSLPTPCSTALRSSSIELKVWRFAAHRGVAQTSKSWFGSSSSQAVSSKPAAVVKVTAFKERVVVVFADATAACHTFDGDVGELRLGTAKQIPLQLLPNSKPMTPASATDDCSFSDRVLSAGFDGKLLLGVFHNSLRAFPMHSLNTFSQATKHFSRISALSFDQPYAATCAGADVVLWEVSATGDLREEMMDLFGAPGLPSPKRANSPQEEEPVLKCKFRLVGHDDAINSVCVSKTLGLVASTSTKLVLHTLHDRGALLRTVDLKGAITDRVAVAPQHACVITYSKQTSTLTCVSANTGEIRCQVFVSPREVNFLQVVGNDPTAEEILVHGGSSGDLFIRSVHDLKVCRAVTHARATGALNSCAVSSDGLYLFVGCEDGSVVVVAADR